MIVIAGGTPLGDATAFAQWKAAGALFAAGAHATVFDLAALGRTDDVMARLDDASDVQDEMNHAFWSACHDNQLATAMALAGRGAEVNWLPRWEDATPMDIASRDGAHDVIRWLHSQGARTCEQLREEAGS